jgi:hypothetical protein
MGYEALHYQPIMLILWIAGVSGLLVGGVTGVLRSATPTLFALASGIQWFTLGSTFWGQSQLSDICILFHFVSV